MTPSRGRTSAEHGARASHLMPAPRSREMRAHRLELRNGGTKPPAVTGPARRGPRAGPGSAGSAEAFHVTFSVATLAMAPWVCARKRSQIRALEMCAPLRVWASINYDQSNREKVELECSGGWAPPGSPHTPLLPTARRANAGGWGLVAL